MIKLIIAIGPNNLLGIDDKMAWSIKEEFQHFKETTMGSWLLMGQTTFRGLPSQLKGRKICVAGLNNKTADKQVENTKEINDFLNKFKDKKETIWIAGGKSIYESFYHKADELIISEVKTDVKGNVFIDWDLSAYKKTLLKTYEKFTVYKYTKERYGN